MKLKFTYFFILYLISTLCISQKVYKLAIVNTDTQTVFKKITYKKQFTTTNFLVKEINNAYLSLINAGYLTTSVDSVLNDSLNYKAYISIGKKMKWVHLLIDKKDEAIVSKLGYSEHFFANRLFSQTELSRFMEKIITHYENNGYPFCTAQLDSLKATSQTIEARLNITKNNFLKLDSLITIGSAMVKQKFLLRYLGIKNGMPYNEAAFKTISNNIKQLPFVTQKSPPVLQLTDKQNKLVLFLDKKNASQFDGIVGILPNEKGKTVFTGDVKIKLVNSIFKTGETFDINWRRLQTQTQDLRARVIYPYLLGLPVGVDYNIKLYKKDTTFLDVNNAIGLNYYINGLNHVKVFYKQRNANLISTAGLTSITVLPEYADVVTKAYGLGVSIEKMDYKYNPHKGFSINAQASVGNRQIKKNAKVNDIAYTNIALKSSQYQAEAEVVGYINIIKNHVIKLSSQFGTVFGNTIYKNELYRIGGLRTLRGFDEESIYASTYVIPTLEYRFLFEKNSNIFLFAEGAIYENANISGYNQDNPISIGAGINFETKAGIFNLSYGLGKQYSNSFDLRTGKIHAGLTALF